MLHNKKKYLLILIIFLYVFLGTLSFVMARRSLRKVHTSWELLMGNRLVMSYYSLGYIGDLYRHKIYNKLKTKRYLSVLQTLIKKDKQFLASFKYPSGRSNKLLFRRIRAVVDMLDMASTSLNHAVKLGRVSSLKQFFIYRNSIARDIGRIFAMKALKRRRYYRGRWRFALKALGHYLGSDTIIAYLMFGLIADGYFQLAFKNVEILPRIRMGIQLLQNSKGAISNVWASVPRKDRIYLKRLQNATISLLNEGQSLRDFISSRRRSYLL